MNPVRPRRKLRADTITLAHGSGGKAMRDLIDDVFVGGFDNAQLTELEDQARFDLADLTQLGNRLAMTTDCYVVDPLFFPGGNIGKLAVTGTVNDLAVGGARPLYLSCGMIIEEGLPVEDLRRIVASMKATADTAGVCIVTGDTKVVHRGAADKLFINTTGIGVIPENVEIRAQRGQDGDVVLINGFIGDHGAAIVDARGEMSLDNTIKTDCQPLNTLVEAMLAVCPDIHCMRDATRGGIATVLNEFAEASGVSINIDEAALPVRDEVHGMCEILGLDPLYLANEGKLLAIVPPERADACLQAMRAHPAGRDSAIIGHVYADEASRVILKTGFGGNRIVDMLVGEQLPRIC
ncbi:hydrogenase expression/formation protein HypE [Thiolapillus sp.]|uniref:hydrogenase expression/formation protein HypE n=1 Tax=Thiolapillus sp. TaxID=2017437 RepID=UPI0025E6DE4C|nr:hydrogenase expression/formation protein HypE [Thiolapillus sp.]